MNRLTKCISIVGVMAVCLTMSSQASAALPTKHVLYVDSKATQDRANGSLEKPFHHFDAAYVAMLKIKEDHPTVEVSLIFREGHYAFNKGYLLGENCSNVTIAGYPNEKVFFSGGVSIPKELIPSATSEDKQILTLDMRKAGISEFGKIRNVGFSRPMLPSWGELFVNGKPMHLSRWPNKGMIRMGKILDAGSVPRNGDFSNRGGVMQYDSARISSWEPTDDMWIGGYFKYGFADDTLRIAKLDKEKKTISTDGPTLYGFYSGHKWNKWYAFNIKEELDEAGEYYLDRDEGKLYFIAHEPQIRTIDFSVLKEPFFDIYKAKNITIQNITFQYSCAAILSLVETEHVLIRDCVFRNSGSIGVIIGTGTAPFAEFNHEGTGDTIRGNVGSLPQHMYTHTTYNRNGGQNNRIDNCQFYDLGAGGVSMGGGDRLTLKAGNNGVANSVFHHNNRIDRSYRPEVHITGVGNRIEHCEMYGSPSMAILMHGNNHLIEGNYIHDVCLEVDDQGAFYYGRNPSECGTIVRNNVFANIPSEYRASAVYLDDGAGGLRVENNVFYKAGRYAVLMGGGSDNVYTGNLFINTPMAIHADNRLQNWAKGMITPKGIFEQRLQAVRYNQEPYATAYPYLKDYIPNDGTPKRNLVENNTFIGIKRISNNPKWLTLKSNTIIEEPLQLTPFSKEKLLELMKNKNR